MPITFTATIERFAKQGEKTGWTYILVEEPVAAKINPGVRIGYYVKGRLDEVAVKHLAMLPMGGGSFIIPLKSELRKKIGKPLGEKVKASLELDTEEYRMNADLLECLDISPEAKAYFDTFSASVQRYYSKWIDSAKTEATKQKRLGICISALERRMDYGAMLRAARDENKLRQI